MLFRVPAKAHRDDGRLAALLAAWPRDMPLTSNSRRRTGTSTRRSRHSRPPARPCAPRTCRTIRALPHLRRTAPFLYLRLRRHDYSAAELAAWAARLEPFLAAGIDAYVFFRHDDDGTRPGAGRSS